MGGQRAGELHGDKVQETSRNHLPEMWLRRCSSGPRPESSRSTLQSLGIPGRPVQRLRPQVSRPALWISEGEMGEMPPLLPHGSIDVGSEVLPNFSLDLGKDLLTRQPLALRSLPLQFRQFSPEAEEVRTTGNPRRPRVGQTDTPNSELPAERLSHAGK